MTLNEQKRIIQDVHKLVWQAQCLYGTLPHLTQNELDGRFSTYTPSLCLRYGESTLEDIIHNWDSIVSVNNIKEDVE